MFLSSSSTGNSVKLFAGFAKALRAQHPIALATRLDDARPGAKLLVSFDSTEGDLGSPGLDHAVTQEARALLNSGDGVGRKLDFLAQEFNREANTLCSKSSDVVLTRVGLALKAAIDQFREQAQNVE